MACEIAFGRDHQGFRSSTSSVFTIIIITVVLLSSNQLLKKRSASLLPFILHLNLLQCTVSNHVIQFIFKTLELSMETSSSFDFLAHHFHSSWLLEFTTLLPTSTTLGQCSSRMVTPSDTPLYFDILSDVPKLVSPTSHSALYFFSSSSSTLQHYFDSHHQSHYFTSRSHSSSNFSRSPLPWL